MPVSELHQSIMHGVQIETDQVMPFYWCAVPPRSAWSTGNMSLTLMTDDGETVPLTRLGWCEISGWFIGNPNPIYSDLTGSALEVLDDWIPKIDATDLSFARPFSPGTPDIGDDDSRTVTLEEGTGDGGEGSASGDATDTSTVLTHPAVFSQVDWLGLGPTRIYHEQHSMGFGVGNGMAIDTNRQSYILNSKIEVSRKGINSGYGIVLFAISIPELGAWTSPGSTPSEEISPWTDWADMIETILRLPENFIELIHATGNPSNDASIRSQSRGPFEEFLHWKRWYNVTRDTWQNTRMKLFIHGQASLTTNLSMIRRHY